MFNWVKKKLYDDLLTFSLRERKRYEDRLEANDAYIGILQLNAEYHRAKANYYKSLLDQAGIDESGVKLK